MNANCEWSARAAHTGRIIAAALRAADPAAAVARVLVRRGDVLQAGARSYNLAGIQRVRVLGIGKAAAQMAQAVVDALPDLTLDGVLITKRGFTQAVSGLQILEAGHPLPDEAGTQAARQLLAAAGQPAPDDLIIFVVSGGGSALFTLPVDGVDLADLQQLNQLLLRSGATIQQFNTVRKHVSQVQGGWLARHLFPAQVLCLVLSDVVGGALDMVASGPLLADPTTYADAVAVLRGLHLWDGVPPRVAAHLTAGLQGRRPETPKPGDAVFGNVHTIMVADNALAAAAALECAAQLGFNPLLVSTALQGEARAAAAAVVELAGTVRRSALPVAAPACLLWGGETTVTMRGAGRGGRNSELALAAALLLEEEGLQRVRIVSFATDGDDGSSAAAGAVAEVDTVERAARAGYNARASLAANDSGTLFAKLGDHILTGNTGTNVNDLMFAMLY
jgi:hydroxypyruvate reductase